MKKRVAELLEGRLQSQGMDADFVDDYSGRGMYGEKTCGVDGDFDHADVAEAVAELFDDGTAQDEGLKPADFRYVTDSMGLGIIIY